MDWDEEKDKKVLLSYKDKNSENDNVRYKELIKQHLLDNKYLIHVLNNKDLEDSEAEADEYFGVNILPYYMIPDAQANVKNFVCYEVSFERAYGSGSSISNHIIKQGQIIFYILCNNEEIIDDETGIARHDLIDAILLNQFNWTNIFGFQVHCVSDKPSTTDSKYATRTIVLQGEMVNSIVKDVNGVKQYANTKFVR